MSVCRHISLNRAPKNSGSQFDDADSEFENRFLIRDRSSPEYRLLVRTFSHEKSKLLTQLFIKVSDGAVKTQADAQYGFSRNIKNLGPIGNPGGREYQF